MAKKRGTRPLQVALVVVGLIFIVGLYPLVALLDSPGWTWEPRQTEYEQMIMGIYATLGVFLLIAARRPIEHRLLIWFTVWSSAVHGGIMLVQALVDPDERANLLGDVPALLLVAVVLGVLMRRAEVSGPKRVERGAEEPGRPGVPEPA